MKQFSSTSRAFIYLFIFFHEFKSDERLCGVRKNRLSGLPKGGGGGGGGGEEESIFPFLSLPHPPPPLPTSLPEKLDTHAMFAKENRY